MAKHKTAADAEASTPTNLDRLKAASDAVDAAETSLEEAKAAAKLRREQWEEAVANLRREVHDACADGPTLPFVDGEGDEADSPDTRAAQ